MRKNKIAIISSLDGFANSVKTTNIQEIMTKRGYSVKVYNTLYLSRMSDDPLSTLNKVPAFTFVKLLLYFTELLDFVISKYFKKGKKYFNYYLLFAQMKLRATILSSLIQDREFDAIIGESQIDSYYFTKKLDTIKVFDCPTPWADELYFSDELTKGSYNLFKRMEIAIYESCDYLSFHWQTYGDYVKEYYEYSKNNIFIFNPGVPKRDVKGKFSKHPKIVYFGNLSGKWINLELLSRLSSMYPIDVYGAPEPDKKYKLNYKGYAKPDILAKYQFGLITITKDQLRSEGFSAKHMDYLSYGLPVLVPEWRKNLELLQGSIPYNESNFLKVIKEYSQRKNWIKMNKLSLQQAKDLNWEISIDALENIIEPRRR